MRQEAKFGLGSVELVGAARKRIAAFGNAEQGLVSVEWVALSAAVVISAIIIGVMVMDGLAVPAQSIGAQLTVMPPPPPP